MNWPSNSGSPGRRSTSGSRRSCENSDSILGSTGTSESEEVESEYRFRGGLDAPDGLATPKIGADPGCGTTVGCISHSGGGERERCLKASPPSLLPSTD